jgi:hypothetical protein
MLTTYVLGDFLTKVCQVALQAALLGDGQQSIENNLVGLDLARDNPTDDTAHVSLIPQCRYPSSRTYGAMNLGRSRTTSAHKRVSSMYANAETMNPSSFAEFVS